MEKVPYNKLEATSSLHSGQENGRYLCGGLFINFLWYAITFLIYFDISFDFEIEKNKNKKTLLLQEEKKKEKKKKSLIGVHRESNPRQLIQSPTC